MAMDQWGFVIINEGSDFTAAFLQRIMGHSETDFLWKKSTTLTSDEGSSYSRV